MFERVIEGAKPARLTASGLVFTGGGNLLGIMVASASASPAITIYDNTTGAAPIVVNTFTPVAGTWYPLPFEFTKGLYVGISGTVDCTVSWRAL